MIVSKCTSSSSSSDAVWICKAQRLHFLWRIAPYKHNPLLLLLLSSTLGSVFTFLSSLWKCSCKTPSAFTSINSTVVMGAIGTLREYYIFHVSRVFLSNLRDHQCVRFLCLMIYSVSQSSICTAYQVNECWHIRVGLVGLGESKNRTVRTSFFLFSIGD